MRPPRRGGRGTSDTRPVVLRFHCVSNLEELFEIALLPSGASHTAQAMLPAMAH